MVIDTSVLVATVLGEPSCPWLFKELQTAASRAVSSVSLLEAGMVLRSRLGEPGVPLLYRAVEELACEVVPFDSMQSRLAIAAFGRFGKGMGHRAQLNFGDCAVYALAESRGEPVLATGNDFAATDLIVV